MNPEEDFEPETEIMELPEEEPAGGPLIELPTPIALTFCLLGSLLILVGLIIAYPPAAVVAAGVGLILIATLSFG